MYEDRTQKVVNNLGGRMSRLLVVQIGWSEIPTFLIAALTVDPHCIPAITDTKHEAPIFHITFGCIWHVLRR